MLVGLDFDGTLATWGRGEKPNYHDPRYAICYANAIYPSISFVRREHGNGHEFVVITGRGVAHRRELMSWCEAMLGFQVPVICRPNTIGLTHEAQAAWKSEMIQRIGARTYIGDNPRIDGEAARLSGARYIPIHQLRQQFLLN